MIPVSPEALHPGPAPTRKGKGGGKKAKRGTPANDALTKLFEWHSANGRSLDGAPPRMLKAARARIKERIPLLRQGLGDASDATAKRFRVQLRWLRRWLQMIRDANGQSRRGTPAGPKHTDQDALTAA